MRNRMDNTLKIAVIAVEPVDKASFVHSCIQTRLKVDTMEMTHSPRLYVQWANRKSNGKRGKT